MPSAPSWSTLIWPRAETGGKERRQVPTSHLDTRGTWTGRGTAPLSQIWETKKQIIWSGLRTLRTGGDQRPGLEFTVSWGMCRSCCSSTCCRGFLWDWLAASLWSYRAGTSATKTKLSSASSSGRLVWSFCGRRWLMPCTSAGLAEGTKTNLYSK